MDGQRAYICVYLRDVPHVDAASPCASTCPVSQGSGGGVFVNDNEEQRAIEHRSIEQRSKPGSSDRRMTNKSPAAANGQAGDNRDNRVV